MKKTFKLFVMTAALLLVLLPAVYASEAAYTIDSVTLADVYGDSFSDDDGICIVTARVTKNKETDGGARVWFAGYSEDGRLLNTEYTDLSIDVGEVGYEVVELISYPDKIDRVSVFIWNKDGSITPLAEGVTKKSEKNYVYYDASLFYSIDETEISFKRNSTTSDTVRYMISPMGAQLFVNGVAYMDTASYSVSDIENVLAFAKNDIKLIPDSAGRVERIEVEYFVYATIYQHTETADTHTLVLSGMKFPGNVTVAATSKNIVKISKYDIEDGAVKVYSERNGEKCSLSEITKDDVIAVKYDISGSIEASDCIDIFATDKKISAKYISYNSEAGDYELMDLTTGSRNQYKSLADISQQLENGRQYEFSLTPDGMLYNYVLIADSYCFAVIENYVDISEVFSPSEYSYIEVMTMEGQAKTLYIETSYDSKARNVLSKMGIDASTAPSLYELPVQDRIVEYMLNDEGRVTKIINAGSGYDITVCYDAEFNGNAGKLGSRSLSPSCRFLDAIGYEKKIQNGNVPTVKDYKAVSALSDGVAYDAILFMKSNAVYYNAIILGSDVGVLNGDSNFTVAAADFKVSSKAIVNDEDVYTLDVMENGASDSAKLNISTNAKAYINSNETELTDIKAGTVFFYTTDADGFVDRISIVYQTPDSFEGLVGMTTENMLKHIYLPYFKGDNAIRESDWIVSLNARDFDYSAKEEIQLFIAPVINDTARGVSFAPIKYDYNNYAYYIDTNESYDFGLASDAKIYSFDMSGDTTGVSRFSTGMFEGIPLKDCDDMGRAWLDWVDDNYNFSEEVQPAFIMVVDGAVTNALIFTN